METIAKSILLRADGSPIEAVVIDGVVVDWENEGKEMLSVPFPDNCAPQFIVWTKDRIIFMNWEDDQWRPWVNFIWRHPPGTISVPESCYGWLNGLL